MNREVLFRGARVCDGKLVDGALVMIKENDESEKYIPNIVISYGPDTFDWFEVVPETVGQFTGRYDKNDKEIFERDIVVNKNIHGKKWIVEYRTDSEYVGFVLKEIGTNGISLFTSWNDIEVIGNIYDNKDLLK